MNQPLPFDKGEDGWGWITPPDPLFREERELITHLGDTIGSSPLIKGRMGGVRLTPPSSEKRGNLVGTIEEGNL